MLNRICLILFYSLTIGSLWFMNVAVGIWLLQHYGLTPRPGDFERLAVFRQGLDMGVLEAHCFGMRPPWERYHGSPEYAGRLFSASPSSCDELQDLMHEAFPPLRSPSHQQRI